MSTEQFRNTNFREKALAQIGQAQAILEEYGDQKLTVRQLYYQFVARDFIENTARSYQNMTSLITDARYAGMIDWDAIEDRGREPNRPSEWDSLDELIESAIKQFRLPRFATQPTYVELWVEKQALAGVLAPIARRHHITLMVNKGYSSASAMKESADRMHEACGSRPFIVCKHCRSHQMFDDQCVDCEKRWEPLATQVLNNGLNNRDGSYIEEGCERPCVVLYLGDHDPSGEDMVRDIKDRLTEFGVEDLEVRKIALTMAQIRQFNPPPNPAKITDSRATKYIEAHGDQSWELDALPPRELNRLVEDAITGLLDQDAMDLVLEEEEAQRDRLNRALAKTKPKTPKGSKS